MYRETKVMKGSDLYAALEANDQKKASIIFYEVDTAARKRGEVMPEHLQNYAIGRDTDQTS